MKSITLFLGALCVLYFCGACGSSSSSGTTPTPEETCPTLSLTGFYATTSSPYIGVDNSDQTGNLLYDFAWSTFFTVSEGGVASGVIKIPGDSHPESNTFSGTWITTETNTIKIDFGDNFILEGTVVQDADTCIVTSNFDMVDGSIIHIPNDDAVTVTYQTVQYPHTLTPADIAGDWRETVSILYNNESPSQTVDQLDGQTKTAYTIDADGTTVQHNDDASDVLSDVFFINDYTVNLSTEISNISVDFVNNRMFLINYNSTHNFGSGDVSATVYRVLEKI